VGTLSAGGIISIAPVVVLFALVQRAMVPPRRGRGERVTPRINATPRFLTKRARGPYL